MLSNGVLFLSTVPLRPLPRFVGGMRRGLPYGKGFLVTNCSGTKRESLHIRERLRDPSTAPVVGASSDGAAAGGVVVCSGFWRYGSWQKDAKGTTTTACRASSRRSSSSASGDVRVGDNATGRESKYTEDSNLADDTVTK